MGNDKSNEWTVSYFLSFSLDAFMVETVINFIKLYIIRNELMTGKTSFMQKFIGNDDLVEFMKRGT